MCALFWGEVRGSVDGGTRKEVEGEGLGRGKRGCDQAGKK